jgi:D-cysteine desulfhydrase
METPLTLLRPYCDAHRLPPYVELGDWPTPVAPLARLGGEVGAEVWVKREDVSGRPYGGNKVRKLEFLLGEALARKVGSVVSVGGIGSNHLVATAVHGRRLGLVTHAVVFPQPVTTKVRAGLQLLCDLGVVFHPVAARPMVPLGVAQARRAAGPHHYVPAGGSSAVGVLGWVAGGLEIARQIDAGELPRPHAVYVPVGTAGTCCGLVLGFALAGLEVEVMGVRVVEALYMNEAVVRVLMRRTARLLAHLGARIGAVRPPTLVEDQIGGGYGQPTPEAGEAVRLMERTEGVRLETTYTGKALAGMIERCRGSGRRVLFVDTYNGRDVGELMEELPARELPHVLQDWITTEPVEV